MLRYDWLESISRLLGSSSLLNEKPWIRVLHGPAVFTTSRILMIRFLWGGGGIVLAN